jgi:hypothetical protein
MYSLDGLMVSSDDDMRPYSMMEASPESLENNEISRGRLHKLNKNGYARKSFDLMSAFLDVLGKPVSEIPENYERGELLIDTAADLETNATKGLAHDNTVMLQRGKVSEDAIVRIAQTFRSGTNDIDAIDFVDMFLDDDQQTNIDDLRDLYVLVNFRPAVTNKNWRMDCGVAGYDNTFGLPPFFPTRLRFEDYIYRLWIQQEGTLGQWARREKTLCHSSRGASCLTLADRLAVVRQVERTPTSRARDNSQSVGLRWGSASITTRIGCRRPLRFRVVSCRLSQICQPQSIWRSLLVPTWSPAGINAANDSLH